MILRGAKLFLRCPYPTGLTKLANNTGPDQIISFSHTHIKLDDTLIYEQDRTEYCYITTTHAGSWWRAIEDLLDFVRKHGLRVKQGNAGVVIESMREQLDRLEAVVSGEVDLKEIE